jgi:hypothetical protein
VLRKGKQFLLHMWQFCSEQFINYIYIYVM